MSQPENYQLEDIITLKSKEAVVKFRAGKFATGQKVENCDTAGEYSLGVVMDSNDAAGGTIGVLSEGFKKIVSGAAYADLANLAVDVDGKYRTATAGQVIVAIAMEQATAADQEKLVFLLELAQHRVASANIVALTDNSGGVASDTLAVITMPADTPASADALRDDLVANALPAIKNAVASLSAKVDAILAVLDAQGITL